MIFPRAIVAQVAALSALAGGALFLSGCGGGASAAPSIPKTNTNLNRIAFSSNRDGDFEIYTMNPDGSDVQRVTTAVGDDTKPAWSRDKTKLAFVSGRDGNAEIYVQNIADGKPVGAAQRITDNPAFDNAPSWNPQGTELVFESNRNTGTSLTELYIASVATRNMRQLTNRPTDFNSNPAWSPDGNLIAFQSSQAPREGQNYPDGIPNYLFTIKPNGEEVKQLTTGGFNNDTEPAWSPDGKKLAFADPIMVAVLNLESGEQSSLTQVNQGDFIDPNYSPDGTQIVCSGFGRPVSQISIYLLQTNGSSETPTRIFEDSSQYKDPSW